MEVIVNTRILIVFIASLLPIVFNTTSAQWEQVGQNPQRTCLAPFIVDTGNDPNPTAASYEIATDGGSIESFMSPPIITGPFVFVGTATGKLICWNVNLSQIQWTKPLGSNKAPAAFADVAVSHSGLSIYGLNTYTGEQLWQQLLGATVVHDVLIDPGTYTVYAVTDAKKVYALNVFTGAIKWIFDLTSVGSNTPVGSPAITANGEFLVTASVPNPNNTIGTVYGIKTADGSFGWSKTVPDPGVSDYNEILGFLAVGDYIYFSNRPHQTLSNSHGWICRLNIVTKELIMVYSPIHLFRSKLALIPGAQWLVYGSGDAFRRGYYKIDPLCQETLVADDVQLIRSDDLAVDQLGDIVMGNSYGFLYKVTLGGTIKQTIDITFGADRKVGSPALSHQMIVAYQRNRSGWLHIIANPQFNQIPELLNQLPQANVAVGGQVTIDLNNPAVFFDRDGDPLSYSTLVIDPRVVSAQVAGNVLTLTGLAQDTSRIVLYAEDTHGNRAACSFNAIVSPMIGVEPSGQTTLNFLLRQNYPNPFNPSTIIEFTVPIAGRAVVRVCTVSGQVVRTLVDAVLQPGSHRIHWNGRDDAGRILPSGIYLYRLAAGKYKESKKMVFLK